jgi:hypothetical protein
LGTSRDGGNLGQGRLRLALGLLVSRFALQQQLENCSFLEETSLLLSVKKHMKKKRKKK